MLQYIGAIYHFYAALIIKLCIQVEVTATSQAIYPKLNQSIHVQLLSNVKYSFVSEYKSVYNVNVRLNTKNIGERFVFHLEDLLLSRIKLLNKIKSKAGESISSYRYDEHIQPFHYYNRRHQPPNPVKIEQSFSKSVAVNLQRSYVQCSTETFVNSTEVLNIARATITLDEVYRDNYVHNPSLLWQMFCTAEGPLRTFPGRK